MTITVSYDDTQVSFQATDANGKLKASYPSVFLDDIKGINTSNIVNTKNTLQRLFDRAHNQPCAKTVVSNKLVEARGFGTDIRRRAASHSAPNLSA